MLGPNYDTKGNCYLLEATAAVRALQEEISRAHTEVCDHLRVAQVEFMQNRPMPSSLAGCSGCSDKPELDLTSLVFRVEDSALSIAEQATDVIRPGLVVRVEDSLLRKMLRVVSRRVLLTI